jgi:hypothetical protein
LLSNATLYRYVTDFVSTSISDNSAAFAKVGDMIPVKWSQQMDGVLGKMGLNL